MKRLLYLIIYIGALLPATAQTIVRDATDSQPKIERAANMQQLLTQLGIRITYQGGEPYITTPDNAGLDIYVDNMNYSDDHDYVLNLIPANVKTVEYFTPNNSVNSIFGVRPAPFTGKVPGVLFIFLKDGSGVIE